MHSLQISEELSKSLSDLACKTGISEKFYAEEAIARFLEDEEDYRLAMEVLSKNEPTIPWEDVKKQLGLNNADLDN